jgi:hypothetical protein
MRARAAAALSRRRWGPLLGGGSAAEEGSGAGVFMSSLRADVCLSSLTLFDRVAVTVVVQSFRSKTNIRSVCGVGHCGPRAGRAAARGGAAPAGRAIRPRCPPCPLAIYLLFINTPASWLGGEPLPARIARPVVDERFTA